ncbi:MAG: hypothetical protein B6242_16815 [Anaerolineaceae bacterium 4572_78]|nr:MAG: hypothetical protein B6242_16815 [Anaerolineaceae bacterium 4572_78]
MEKLKFSECTLVLLDELFILYEDKSLEILKTWLHAKAEIDTVENQVLKRYQRSINIYWHDWNEFELIQHFIGPMFALVDFSNRAFGLFAQRNFATVVNGIELHGKPDGIIASGYRSPKQPYFCFQEYKREQDPEGDPAGQCLAAMLVAQEMNEHKHPIYGCYVVGANWYFMALCGKKYAISPAYVATREHIFDIFRILKVLKEIIINLVGIRAVQC